MLVTLPEIVGHKVVLEATDLKAMWRNSEKVLHGSNFIPEIKQNPTQRSLL
jgi:hypothetical protein